MKADYLKKEYFKTKRKKDRRNYAAKVAKHRPYILPETAFKQLTMEEIEHYHPEQLKELKEKKKDFDFKK